MNVNKLLGIAVRPAIVGLSLGDALTGHGVKGNKNLNPLIVGVVVTVTVVVPIVVPVVVAVVLNINYYF
ncbi:MAG: hypothetical protein LBL04_02315 [Bacteroidales bacterium]|jgi:hypothetical protein|nr:hypothetical protein [Bacteroidales bacterium]